MNRLVDILNDYFKNTPKDVLDKDWNALKELNNIGPDTAYYVESVMSNTSNNQLTNVDASPVYCSPYKEDVYFLAA